MGQLISLLLGCRVRITIDMFYKYINIHTEQIVIELCIATLMSSVTLYNVLVLNCVSLVTS